MPTTPAILFTAFEPSGDDHASIVIAELKRRRPSMPIYAWGGPKMERAGATIIERTTGSGVMGLPGIGKIVEHVRINRRIEDWLDQHRVAAHIPVDSPDANFPISQLVKERGGRIIHCVAPQLWAWRSGRIKKLRKMTDLVLCVLPFEEEWFRSRSVPARFVGHPLFDHVLDYAELDAIIARWPQGSPRIALMPGSRPGEIRKCFPLLLDAWRRISKNFPQALAVTPMTHPEVEDTLRSLAATNGGWPENLHLVAGNTDAAIRWCELAIVTSGTVTLQVAKQQRPMVTFYRFGKHLQIPFELFGRRVFKTRYFTLPNLIVNRKAVPELVPHFEDGHALAVGAFRLLRQPGLAEQQVRDLGDVIAPFQSHHFGPMAADAIEELIGLRAPRAAGSQRVS